MKKERCFVIGLAIRILLTFVLPILMDDGVLIQGVRYTDTDYFVFTDAAAYVSQGRSPYERHTYRYTPFLACLLSLPLKGSEKQERDSFPAVLSFLPTNCFGKILFCVADALCGYIIVILRRRKRATSGNQQTIVKHSINLSPDFVDAMWWLYNPLSINICTRGSAESLLVLLPVLGTIAVAEMHEINSNNVISIMGRACVAGTLHGVGIHAKLFPVIYTISYMAHFSISQQRATQASKSTSKHSESFGWTHSFLDQNQSRPYLKHSQWRHPQKLFVLAMLWIQRLFFTMSSVLFLVFAMGTVTILTIIGARMYGQDAINEGILYHFGRVDHRHNYSMYWYWIYLARWRTYTHVSFFSSLLGHIPLIPQALIVVFTSLGIAPYDLTFTLFSQTFAFVAFNKVLTAQYFTWYLCLLPLCSDRILWKSSQILFSLCFLLVSLLVWLLSAYSLEMLGWKSHRQVWMASLGFYIANLILLRAILNGYQMKNYLKRKTE